MDEERTEGSPYFRLPAGDWSDLDPALKRDVAQLCGDVEALAPRDVALKMSELANRLFEQLNGEERDIRQVITTLRTAHAVAWDFYDAVQATRTSVDQYMQALRKNIDSFEDDLAELQKARPAA